MRRSSAPRLVACPRVERLETRDVPSASGHPWPIPQAMSISFVPDGTQIGSFASDLHASVESTWGPRWQEEILAAFQTWAARTGINLGLKADGGQPLGTLGYATGSLRFGDIRVAAHPMPPDVIGYSVPFDPTSGTWAGDVILNSAYAHPDGGEPSVDLYTVFLHEAGNIFGLKDNDDPASALYAYYIGERQGLSEGDIRSIQELYGVRPPDFFEGPTGNASVETATPILIGPWGPAEAVLADLNEGGDVDVYRVLAPSGADRIHVRLVTSGISLLTPEMTVMDAGGRVVGSAVSTNPMAGFLEVLVDGIAAGQDIFVKVRGARGDAFDVGAYALVADTADGTRDALDRLYLKVTGVFGIMAQYETGLPTTPEGWEPVVKVLFNTPAQGHPVYYTQAMGEVLDGFLASLGGKPFDIEVFGKLTEHIATFHHFTLVEPGIMDALLRGLQERGVMDDLIRDLWGRTDLRGVLHGALRSGALNELFLGLSRSGHLNDLVRDVWASEAVREEIFGLIQAGTLDGVLTELLKSDEIRSQLPADQAMPADINGQREMAIAFMSRFEEIAEDDAALSGFLQALITSTSISEAFLDLMGEGALDNLILAMLGSAPAGQLAGAVLSAGLRHDTSVMAALIKSTFPTPHTEFETARELFPFWTAVGGPPSFLFTTASTDDARPSTISKVTVPHFDAGAPETMIISAVELLHTPTRPKVRVLDANGRQVDAQVLDSGDGISILQVLRPEPGATYFIEVSQVGGASGPTPGIYIVTATFEPHPFQFSSIASGRFDAAGGTVLETYEAPETQLIHGVFSVRGGTSSGGADRWVRLKIVDSSGAVVRSEELRAGEDVGMVLHLPRGAYSLVFEADPAEGGQPSELEFAIRAHALSDSINPYPEETSLTPIGQAPASPSVAAGNSSTLASTTLRLSEGLLGIPTLGPLSAPYMSTLGAEGPAEVGSLAIARGIEASPTTILLAGDGQPTGEAPFGPRQDAGAGPIFSEQLARVDRSQSADPDALPAIQDQRRGALRLSSSQWSRRQQMTSGGRQALAGPEHCELAGVGAGVPLISLDEAVYFLASADLAAEMSGALEALIQDQATEILLAVGLVAGGMAGAVGRRSRQGTLLLGPASAFDRKRARATGPRQDRRRDADRRGQSMPTRVLLIRTSSRKGGCLPTHRWLEADGVSVHEESGTGWESGLISNPELILLEHDPRTAEDLDLLRRIARLPSAAAIPVILFCSTDSGDLAEAAAEGLDRGAIDVLPRAVTPVEFRARLCRAMRLRRQLENLAREASTDGLTGLSNRSTFDVRLVREWDICRRLGRPVGLLIADLDRFKRINDTCGHPVGDEVLRRVASALAGEVGTEGLAARYGGEEFVVVAPGLDRTGMMDLAERIRLQVKGLVLDDLLLPGRLSMSVGVTWTDAPEEIVPEELLSRADRALYEAKSGGRDMVRIWGDPCGGSTGVSKPRLGPGSTPSPGDRTPPRSSPEDGLGPVGTSREMPALG